MYNIIKIIEDKFTTNSIQLNGKDYLIIESEYVNALLDKIDSLQGEVDSLNAEVYNAQIELGIQEE